MNSIRYIILSFALGLIAVWGSEMFFWGYPQPDLTIEAWVVTYLAYSLCCATALSLVILTGIRGLHALFLGGAMLGFLIEGVVVGQMYIVFPFQLVWTPLAWHALITGVCILGLCRAGPQWPLWRHTLGLFALGLGGAFFAIFWPLDEGRGHTIPDGDAVFAYLVGIGLIVVFANWLIDRLGEIPRPPLLVTAIMPVFALIIWVWTTLADPNPIRAFWPAMVGLTIWAMAKLGKETRPSIGPKSRLWRHMLFLLAPLTMLMVAVPVWENDGALPTNWVVAGITVPLSLGWWIMLLWRAKRVSRGAS